MSRTQQMIGVSALLGVAVLVTYGQVLGHGFINLDDDQYVTANSMVLGGLTVDGVVRSFIEFASFNWHPMTWMSHMLDVSLFGMAPSGHHATNVLLHTANTVMLFWILANATSRHWLAAITAGIFALHPAHVESVAWVSERKDVLSTFFLLLTLGQYLRYCAAPNAKTMALVTLCYALGLMSKPMLITLPFVLLLFDVWPLNRLSVDWNEARAQLPSLLKEKAALFGLTIASIVVTVVAQATGGAMKAGSVLSAGPRIENALVSYSRYTAKAFVPIDLAIYYPHPGGWPLLYVCGSGLLLIGISLAVVLRRKQQPYLAVGWFWFVGSLVPVVGLVQVGSQSLADRYTYVPYVGLSIAVVWGIADLLAGSQRGMRVGAAFAGLVVVIFGVQARSYAAKFENSITVFTHSLMSTDELYPSVIGQGNAPNQPSLPLHNGLYTPYYNLGTAYAEAGSYNKARQHFEAAIKAHPGFPEVYINLGVVLAQQGDYNGSRRYYEQALEVDPHNELALQNLALLRRLMKGQ